MRLRIAKISVAGGLLLAAATGHASVDARSDPRLAPSEARMFDAERLNRSYQQIAQVSDGSGGGGSGSAQPSNMFGLLQDLQALQDELRSLRGEVDRLKFEQRQAKQRELDLYQDLDGRLQQLEQSGIAAGGQPDNSGSVDEEAAEKAYLAARESLGNGRYKEAASAFQSMVEAHPGSRFEAAAYYWMGEAHYVEREYADAEKALSRVINDFADSDKVADAMYRLGVVYDEQGKTSKARRTLQAVTEQHPDTRAAQEARKHLKAIGG